MNLDHLMWEQDGWGYLPPSDQVLAALSTSVEISNATNILEIGFYAGHSTTYLANVAPQAKIYSCCPDHPRGRTYSKVVMDLFPNVRVELTPSPLIFPKLMGRKYDLCFLDGNHTYSAAITDFMMCRELRIPYILFDNSELNTVRSVISHLVDNGSIDIIKEFTYNSTFKERTQINGLTLVKLL